MFVTRMTILKVISHLLITIISTDTPLLPCDSSLCDVDYLCHTMYSGKNMLYCKLYNYIHMNNLTNAVIIIPK